MKKFVRRICLSLEAFYKGEKEHIFRKECEVGITHRDTGKEKVWTVGQVVRDCCSMAVVEGRVSACGLCGMLDCKCVWSVVCAICPHLTLQAREI